MPLLSLQLYSASQIPPLAALQREASFLRYGGVPVSSPVDTQSHPSSSRKSLSPISPHTAGPAMSVSLRTASSSTSILPKARPSSSRRWPRRRTPLAPLPGLRPHPLHGNQRRALLHSERKRQGHHGRRPHQSRLRGRCGSAESQGDDRAGGGGAENIVKALLKSEIDVLPCTGFHYNKITDASIHPPATPRLPQR